MLCQGNLYSILPIKRFDCLSERRNIVVMADEAHRGQYENDELIAITKELTETLRRNKTIAVLQSSLSQL